tara:strand:- start:450 stop:641 length:192 start_codon:yes stop_codon:yes gene_type:complete
MAEAPAADPFMSFIFFVIFYYIQGIINYVGFWLHLFGMGSWNIETLIGLGLHPPLATTLGNFN